MVVTLIIVAVFLACVVIADVLKDVSQSRQELVQVRSQARSTRHF